MEISCCLPQGSVLHGKSYDYKIVRPLGQGSFGITYLASVQMRGELGSIDSVIHVAIKEFFMHEINGREGSTVTSGSKSGLFYDYKKKFVREAKNLGKMQHVNIVKVVEQWEENETAYFSMEYIDGGSLDYKIVECGGLSQQQAVSYAMEIGAALSFMHHQHMLHLDLKPGNVMLKNGRAVLIDFGLSKQYGANDEPESSTSVGGGTAGYAPLEQANNRDGKGFPVTMDIYALGATMFKMLTGRTPPYADTVLNEGLPIDELKQCGISGELICVIEKAMEPKRKDRYQRMDEMLDALKNLRTVCETPLERVVEEVTDITEYGPKYGKYKIWQPNDSFDYELVERIVTNPMPIPDDKICIQMIKKNGGRSLEIVLDCREITGGNVSEVVTFLDGKKICEERFPYKIPHSAYQFIIDHGFLSRERWEIEPMTRMTGTAPYSVSIKFYYTNGNVFSRQVEYAIETDLLFKAIVELTQLKSIQEMINSPKSLKVIEEQELKVWQEKYGRNIAATHPMDIKSDTTKVSIHFNEASVGYHIGNLDYSVTLTSKEVKFLRKQYSISKGIFEAFLEKLRGINIQILDAPIKCRLWSESPERFEICLYNSTGCYAKHEVQTWDRRYGLEGDILLHPRSINDTIVKIIPHLDKYLSDGGMAHEMKIV